MLVVGCSSEPIDGNKLVERGGLHYEINSDKPFSGEVVSYYSNGQKKSEGTWKDGKEIERTEWQYYDNGQIIWEYYFKDGKLDGKMTYWHSNGQKESEGIHKAGEFISRECWDYDGNECECGEYGYGCK